MASNSDGLRDSDGDSSDWIELCNPTASPVNLGGWRLTDDAGDLNQWVFPETWLDPGEFLTVFASGKNRDVAGAGAAHQFQAQRRRRVLGARAVRRPIVSQYAPSYPPQETNVSYGVGFSTHELISSGSTAKALVPPMDSWHRELAVAGL